MLGYRHPHLTPPLSSRQFYELVDRAFVLFSNTGIDPIVCARLIAFQPTPPTSEDVDNVARNTPVRLKALLQPYYTTSSDLDSEVTFIDYVLDLKLRNRTIAIVEGYQAICNQFVAEQCTLPPPLGPLQYLILSGYNAVTGKKIADDYLTPRPPRTIQNVAAMLTEITQSPYKLVPAHYTAIRTLIKNKHLISAIPPATTLTRDILSIKTKSPYYQISYTGIKALEATNDHYAILEHLRNIFLGEAQTLKLSLGGVFQITTLIIRRELDKIANNEPLQLLEADYSEISKSTTRYKTTRHQKPAR